MSALIGGTWPTGLEDDPIVIKTSETPDASRVSIREIDIPNLRRNVSNTDTRNNLPLGISSETESTAYESGIFTAVVKGITSLFPTAAKSNQELKRRRKKRPLAASRKTYSKDLGRPKKTKPPIPHILTSDSDSVSELTLGDDLELLDAFSRTNNGAQSPTTPSLDAAGVFAAIDEALSLGTHLDRAHADETFTKGKQAPHRPLHLNVSSDSSVSATESIIRDSYSCSIAGGIEALEAAENGNQGDRNGIIRLFPEKVTKIEQCFSDHEDVVCGVIDKVEAYRYLDGFRADLALLQLKGTRNMELEDGQAHGPRDYPVALQEPSRVRESENHEDLSPRIKVAFSPQYRAQEDEVPLKLVANNAVSSSPVGTTASDHSVEHAKKRTFDFDAAEVSARRSVIGTLSPPTRSGPGGNLEKEPIDLVSSEHHETSKQASKCEQMDEPVSDNIPDGSVGVQQIGRRVAICPHPESEEGVELVHFEHNSNVFDDEQSVECTDLKDDSHQPGSKVANCLSDVVDSPIVSNGNENFALLERSDLSNPKAPLVNKPRSFSLQQSSQHSVQPSVPNTPKSSSQVEKKKPDIIDCETIEKKIAVVEERHREFGSILHCFSEELDALVRDLGGLSADWRIPSSVNVALAPRALCGGKAAGPGKASTDFVDVDTKNPLVVDSIRVPSADHCVAQARNGVQRKRDLTCETRDGVDRITLEGRDPTPAETVDICEQNPLTNNPDSDTTPRVLIDTTNGGRESSTTYPQEVRISSMAKELTLDPQGSPRRERDTPASPFEQYLSRYLEKSERRDSDCGGHVCSQASSIASRPIVDPGSILAAETATGNSSQAPPMSSSPTRVASDRVSLQPKPTECNSDTNQRLLSLRASLMSARQNLMCRVSSVCQKRELSENDVEQHFTTGSGMFGSDSGMILFKPTINIYGGSDSHDVSKIATAKAHDQDSCNKPDLNASKPISGKEADCDNNRSSSAVDQDRSFHGQVHGTSVDRAPEGEITMTSLGDKGKSRGDCGGFDLDYPEREGDNVTRYYLSSAEEPKLMSGSARRERRVEAVPDKIWGEDLGEREAQDATCPARHFKKVVLSARDKRRDGPEPMHKPGTDDHLVSQDHLLDLETCGLTNCMRRKQEERSFIVGRPDFRSVRDDRELPDSCSANGHALADEIEIVFVEDGSTASIGIFDEENYIAGGPSRLSETQDDNYQKPHFWSAMLSGFPSAGSFDFSVPISPSSPGDESISVVDLVDVKSPSKSSSFTVARRFSGSGEPNNRSDTIDVFSFERTLMNKNSPVESVVYSKRKDRSRKPKATGEYVEGKHTGRIIEIPRDPLLDQSPRIRVHPAYHNTATSGVPSSWKKEIYVPSLSQGDQAQSLDTLDAVFDLSHSISDVSPNNGQGGLQSTPQSVAVDRSISFELHYPDRKSSPEKSGLTGYDARESNELADVQKHGSGSPERAFEAHDPLRYIDAMGSIKGGTSEVALSPQISSCSRQRDYDQSRSMRSPSNPASPSSSQGRGFETHGSSKRSTTGAAISPLISSSSRQRDFGQSRPVVSPSNPTSPSSYKMGDFDVGVSRIGSSSLLSTARVSRGSNKSVSFACADELIPAPPKIRLHDLKERLARFPGEAREQSAPELRLTESEEYVVSSVMRLNNRTNEWDMKEIGEEVFESDGSSSSEVLASLASTEISRPANRCKSEEQLAVKATDSIHGQSDGTRSCLDSIASEDIEKRLRALRIRKLEERVHKMTRDRRESELTLFKSRQNNKAETPDRCFSPKMMKDSRDDTQELFPSELVLDIRSPKNVSPGNMTAAQQKTSETSPSRSPGGFRRNPANLRQFLSKHIARRKKP